MGTKLRAFYYQYTFSNINFNIFLRKFICFSAVFLWILVLLDQANILIANVKSRNINFQNSAQRKHKLLCIYIYHKKTTYVLVYISALKQSFG